MEESEIRALLGRLARPHPSGGQVIERAALLAAGSDAADLIEWITTHAGEPETAAAPGRALGLHGTRIADGAIAGRREPQRYVLPAGVLTN